jgi:hypothetical protein
VKPKNRSLNTAGEDIEKEPPKPVPRETSVLDLTLQGYKVAGKGMVKGFMVVRDSFKWLKDKSKTE